MLRRFYGPHAPTIGSEFVVWQAKRLWVMSEANEWARAQVVRK
jgi:hypothetical protein